MNRRSLMVSMVGGPAIGLALLGHLGAASARAQGPVVTTEVAALVDRQVFNPKTGEAVRLNARVKLVTEVTLTPTGGAQVKLKAEGYGTGIGQTSGATYLFTGFDQLNFDLKGPLPSDFAGPCTAHITGPRTQDSLPVSVHIQITVNADGRIAAVVRDVTAR